MPCNIAFDYDGTISKDADGFMEIMETLQARGHNVFVVTARREHIHPEDFHEIEKRFKVYKSRHIAKRLYMREIEGMEVDIWVDDMPEAVVQNWEGAPRTFRDLEVRNED